jgi:NitT/TauT family transport system substrate-binding protein
MYFYGKLVDTGRKHGPSDSAVRVVSLGSVAKLAVVLALIGCGDRAAERSALAGAARTPSVAAAVAKRPLRIAYSDWTGWAALEIGVQRGWFKKAGVAVELTPSDSSSSLDAFSAGRVDAVMMTNGDALVAGAAGARSKMILLTDYSNGSDKVVARPGIASFKDLKGKRVGLELTLVDHLLFLKACEKNGMTAKDVELVNVPTSETPQALAAGDVAAIAVSYPLSAQALRFAAGAKPIFTSAELPGLIYGAAAVNPTSLAQRRDDWVKFAKVWYWISDFIRDPKTRDQALAVMAAKIGASPEQYAAAMSGTYFLSLQEAKARYTKSAGLDSLYGSTSVADHFNVEHKVYKDPQRVDDYVDPGIVASL